MALKRYRPTSPGRRGRVDMIKKTVSKNNPEKSLTSGVLRGPVGRSKGRVSTRHRQVGAKKLYRLIDYKRDKRDIPAKVVRIEYDPNRGADIALLVYKDGEKRYILAPESLQVGQEIIAGNAVEAEVGNSLPLSKVPLGMFVHNVEMRPGKGGQLARGAGSSCSVMAKEGDFVLLRLPSGEIRNIPHQCYATIGVLSNADWKHRKLGKAGRRRHLGWRPAVRGVAMHPDAHPHGGGEGRSPIGMPSPKSPWGKKTMGKKTRKKGKASDKYIVKRGK